MDERAMKDSSKYASIFPYQVSFSYLETGKRIPSSKRAISFRFGLADRHSLENGQKGIECCGDEHSIVITWSVRSGKLRITVDDKPIPIHWQQETNDSNGERNMESNGKSLQDMKKAVDVSWSLPVPDDATITDGSTGHAAATKSISLQFRGYATQQEHTLKQYDLLVDGRSFFKLPKLSQVGVSAYVISRIPCDEGQQILTPSASLMSQAIPTRPPTSYLESIEAPMTPFEDEAFLNEALRRSQENSNGRRQVLEEEKVEVDEEMKLAAGRPSAVDPSPLSYDGVEPLM